MCGYEFNIAAAGGAIAGAVLGHFYSTSELAPSTIVHWCQDGVARYGKFLLNAESANIAASIKGKCLSNNF